MQCFFPGGLAFAMRKKIISFLPLFIFLSAAAQQQIGNFMAYGPETKYLSGFNYRVYQSKTGYLWICTMNGVVRFDGKRYKNFFSDYLNPNSLTDNIAADVTEDKNGDLWIAGFVKGATRYNQRTGVFRKYPVLSNDGNPIYGINKIVNDQQDNLWFATAGRGIALYDFAKDTFSFFYPEPNGVKDGTRRGDNFINDIVPDPGNKDRLWIAGFHGLFSFDKTKRQFLHYPGISKDPLKDILVSDIEWQSNGLLWVGTWGAGMKCFDTRQKQFCEKNIPFFSNIVYDIKCINDSVLYAACLGKGLFRYDIKKNTVEDITPVDNAALAMSKKTDIQKISLTSGGGIFAGSQFYLYQEHPFYTRLRKNVLFSKNDETKETLNAVVWDETSRQYWLSSYDGIYSLDESQQTIQKHISRQRDNFFYQVIVGNNNQLWLTSSKEGLYKYDIPGKKLYRPAAETGLPDSVLGSIRKLAADSAGNTWFYGAQHLYYAGAATGKPETFTLQWDKNYRGRRIARAAELLVSPAGEAWLLTQQGIFIYNKNGFVKHLYKTGTTQNDMAEQAVMTGDFSRKYKAFWFTSGDGLQVMNYETHKILSYHTVGAGLPSMMIRGVVIDSLDRVWVATSAGLGYFDPAKKIWQTFNRFDGLETDFLDGGIFITKNNMIAVPQEDGFSFYNPSHIIIAADTPKLRITSLLVNNTAYTDTILPEFVKQLDLPYHQNNIIIEYAAMDWVYPAKTNYRYLIEGVPGQDTWLPNDDARLNLAGLQPGKYVLRVRALGSGGIWSNEIILPITIHPPFWKTWWFIAAVLLLVCFAGWKLFQYRLAQVKKLQFMRNNISRNLHDDIGSSLSNIGILNELAKRNMEQDKEKASEYLNRAAEDIQHISENLGDIVWNINPMFDNINNLLIRMKRYGADMAEGKNISCEFDMPGDADIYLPMDKRSDFYLLYKEAINNMVKHSGAKKAMISITANTSQLDLFIRDDGKGFDETLQKEGNGLANMRQRAKQLNGKLRIRTAPGKGTSLHFSMPV